ncbi:MAG TPA: hypothetical protein VG649_16335 [Candidatus Angelobacter sp.]|jgi:hypothetical protein|nr:hypothetical protein [Candidatus Angelobacter sp.]
MNPEERKRAAEQWLDETLDLCKAASPRAGLETRILAHLHAHAVRWKQRWIFALAGSVAVLFAVITVRVMESRRAAASPDSPQTKATQRTAPEDTARGPREANMPVVQACTECDRGKQHTAMWKSGTKNDVAVLAAGLKDVKQELFPSPIPLSEERTRLQLYLRQTPKQELNMIAQRQRSAPVPDLTIEPIDIKELTPIEDLDPKGNL